MSLENTRDIGKVKLVMLGGGGGGGSYTAGSGISISNSVITNIRKGALTGVIDSVSTNIAHTQITGARDTFAAGALILLQSEAAGTADNLRIQYGAQASDSQTFAIYDTSGTAASVTIASGDTVIMMIDNTGYRAIILNVLSASGGSSYAGLGIGKKKTVTNNVIDTDIDLHRAPIVGDRLLVYFDATVQNPTGLTTYNNGTAVTSNLEPVTPMYINGGWNILEFKNDGFLYNNCWVRMQNVDVPTTLSGLSDTAITSPSDGQMLAYDNSSSMWKNKTIAANNGGTPVRELKTLQIGDAVFDAFGLKTFDVTSVTSGVNGAISVDVITASQLDGEIIAVHTGAYTGSTGNAWTLALSDAQTVEALTMSKADGTAFTDALAANSLMFVKVNTSNDTAVVLSIVGAGSDVSGNGSGSPVAYLNKLKIGSAIYDTSAIRPFSVSQIANNTVKIFVADTDQLGGKVIALSTGALTGTTSSAWSLNLVDTSGGAVSLSVDMLNADGTAFSDDITANELLFVAIDLTNYEGTVLSIAGASGGGDGVATSVVGTVENGTTASQAYAVGEHFIRNDAFCTAIAAIASGATLTQGTNYVEGTIADNIADNYSETETFTGKYWIDGRKIYRTVVIIGYLPNSTSKDVTTNIIPHEIVDIHGTAASAIGGGYDGYVIAIPYQNDVSYVGVISSSTGKLTLHIVAGSDRSAFYGKMVVEYTK